MSDGTHPSYDPQAIEAAPAGGLARARRVQDPGVSPTSSRTVTSSPPPRSPRATSTSAMSAATRSATPMPAIAGPAATPCCSPSALMPSACPPSSARSPAASRRATGSTAAPPHDRTARAPRLLLRLGALVPQLRPHHVPLVAVAFSRAARRRSRLSRDGKRRLVRHLPDDPRHDPGRGRALLALPQPRPADPTTTVVPPRQRLRARRTTGVWTSWQNWDEISLASQRFVLGRVDGVEVDLSCPPGTGEHADGLHSPRRRVGAGALRADLAQAPRHRRLGCRSGGTRAPGGAPLRRPRAQLARRRGDPPDRHRPLGAGTRRRRPLPVLISPVVDGRFGATAVFGIPEHDHTDAMIAERLLARA